MGGHTERVACVHVSGHAFNHDLNIPDLFNFVLISRFFSSLANQTPTQANRIIVPHETSLGKTLTPLATPSSNTKQTIQNCDKSLF